MNKIIREYESGFRGWVPDQAKDDAFVDYLRSSGRYAYGLDAVANSGLYGTGEGKLSLPYMAAVTFYPGCLPGGAQQRGSCVAWSTRNAAMVSYLASIMYGPNHDREVPPLVSDVGVKNGAFSTAGIYWFRGHGGDGWQCSEAAQVAISKCGLLVNQNYPDIGIDLTKYSPSIEGRWGAYPPPANVQEVCKKNLCENATVCTSWEQVRDMLANGTALSSCGSEAFVSQRDTYGVCARSSSVWYHAMAIIAADDRDEIKDRTRCKDGGLVLVQNSWGSYLDGPDMIWGTNKRIPVGSFWSRWDDVKNRYFVALGAAAGWPARKLPDWGLEGIV